MRRWRKTIFTAEVVLSREKMYGSREWDEELTSNSEVCCLFLHLLGEYLKRLEL